jgi:hypothetical protein
MFSIELEIRSEDFKKLNRKMFGTEREAKLLVLFQTADFLIGEILFGEAITRAKAVRKQIKKNDKEDETKLK